MYVAGSECVGFGSAVAGGAVVRAMELRELDAALDATSRCSMLPTLAITVGRVEALRAFVNAPHTALALLNWPTGTLPPGASTIAP